jgi:class 3 adenylate cyclase
VGETRKIAAILVSDVVGYSRLTGADEDRILARLRTLRSDLIDPIISVHHGRVVKRTGDGAIVEFRSVVDAVNCAIEVQRAMVERHKACCHLRSTGMSKAPRFRPRCPFFARVCVEKRPRRADRLSR